MRRGTKENANLNGLAFTSLAKVTDAGLVGENVGTDYGTDGTNGGTDAEN